MQGRSQVRTRDRGRGWVREAAQSHGIPVCVHRSPFVCMWVCGGGGILGGIVLTLAIVVSTIATLPRPPDHLRASFRHHRRRCCSTSPLRLRRRCHPTWRTRESVVSPMCRRLECLGRTADTHTPAVCTQSHRHTSSAYTGTDSHTQRGSAYKASHSHTHPSSANTGTDSHTHRQTIQSHTHTHPGSAYTYTDNQACIHIGQHMWHAPCEQQPTSLQE
eukprot:GHVU01219406.1.p1 GENE.GHVU01219406.1~~GHVU01219406.1.p1  ORF type:complete len:218 (+),score=5.92 GHVU01219406.1:278-931(+)